MGIYVSLFGPFLWFGDQNIRIDCWNARISDISGPLRAVLSH
ncbi:hypothetical protein ADIS_0280 [Lunatimonas lonarensis]|uniref:Uncharacterized protein n=1 Tax=Lunatimonas lonarensis TaxID=1232681 RepID=R7ZYV9_9BACT|nr:hypothetical protein ADIS_0280 [Lunatimonas lonarensis]